MDDKIPESTPMGECKGVTITPVILKTVERDEGSSSEYDPAECSRRYIVRRDGQEEKLHGCKA